MQRAVLVTLDSRNVDTTAETGADLQDHSCSLLVLLALPLLTLQAGALEQLVRRGLASRAATPQRHFRAAAGREKHGVHSVDASTRRGAGTGPHDCNNYCATPPQQTNARQVRWLPSLTLLTAVPAHAMSCRVMCWAKRELAAAAEERESETRQVSEATQSAAGYKIPVATDMHYLTSALGVCTMHQLYAQILEYYCTERRMLPAAQASRVSPSGAQECAGSLRSKRPFIALSPSPMASCWDEPKASRDLLALELDWADRRALQELRAEALWTRTTEPETPNNLGFVRT